MGLFSWPPRGFGMPGITFAPAAPDALWARRLADPPSELSEMEPALAPDRPIGGLHDVSSTFPWFGLSSPPRLRGGGPHRARGAASGACRLRLGKRRQARPTDRRH